MSMLLRNRTWQGALIVLCGLCITAGITAATTSGAQTTFHVDHQLCYTATGKYQPPPFGHVRLIDQFSPNGFLPKINPALALHCNPVNKTITTAAGKTTFKVTNPRAHLACLPITPNKAQPTPKVLVKNQFGKAILYLGQPNLLCLPSWKSLTGPPNIKPTTPPGLNHFTCYPVKDMSNGSYKPVGSVLLQDQFSTKPVPVQVNPLPRELCLPTKKIVTISGSSTTYPIIDSVHHLLCFAVTKTPFKPKVWDENQFGTSAVTIKATKWLCLPSTKQVVK
jgi:hypothetical protein